MAPRRIAPRLMAPRLMVSRLMVTRLMAALHVATSLVAMPLKSTIAGRLTTKALTVTTATAVRYWLGGERRRGRH